MEETSQLLAVFLMLGYHCMMPTKLSCALLPDETIVIMWNSVREMHFMGDIEWSARPVVIYGQLGVISINIVLVNLSC